MQFTPGVVFGVVPTVHMKSQEALEKGTGGVGVVPVTQESAPVWPPTICSESVKDKTTFLLSDNLGRSFTFFISSLVLKIIRNREH